MEDLVQRWESARTSLREANRSPTTWTVPWWEEWKAAELEERRTRTALARSGLQGRQYVRDRIGDDIAIQFDLKRRFLPGLEKGVAEEVLASYRAELLDLKQQAEELGIEL